MLTTQEFLDPLARVRTDEVVIASMGVVRPWGRLSDHDLDFASARRFMTNLLAAAKPLLALVPAG